MARKTTRSGAQAASRSYSSFNSFINMQPIDRRFVQQTQYERIDTLNYVQITQTFGAGASYKLADNTDLSRTIATNSAYNASSNKQGSSTQANNMFSMAGNYNQVWKKSQLTLGIGTTFNQTSFVAGIAKYIGLTGNASLPLFKKKVRASLNLNINNSYENDALKARLYTATNSYSMKLGKHHSLNAGLRYSGRAKLAEATLTRYNTTFNEFFVDAGYAFNF